MEPGRGHNLGNEWPPVLTKSDFVRRYQLGEFGNRSPTWDTVDDLLQHGAKFPRDKKVPGRFHLRNRVASGETYYNLHWSECVAKWCEQEDKTGWYASEMCPHEHNRIQGEVMQSCWHDGGAGLSLLYSPVVGKPMRDALRELSVRQSGILAVNLLKHHLCPDSWEWLNILLDRYPGHVVEFTALDVRWGTIPGFNTLFWEVRSY